MRTGTASQILAPAFAIAFLLAVAAPADSFPEHEWGAGSYLYYSTGDYGGSENTDFLYWPGLLHRYTERWQFTLTVPFVHMRSPEAHFIVDGEAVAVDTGEAPERESNSGLGDVIFKATHHLVDQQDMWPWISVFGRVKLPTADEEKGLGTGKTDVGLGVETVRFFENGLLSFFDVGYTFIGEPSGADFSNRWSLSAGLGYRTTPDVMLAVFYEWRTAIAANATDPRALSFLITRRVRHDLRTFVMTDLGLSDGAADFAAAAGFTHRF